MGTGQGCTLTTEPFPSDRAEELMRIAASAVRRESGFEDDDLISIVVKEAVEKWSEYDPKFKLSTWVGQIAFRRHQDQIRQSGREGRKLKEVFAGLSAEVFADIESSKRANGRPGLTDGQKLYLARIAARGLSCRAVWRFLLLNKMAMRGMGLKYVPSERTIQYAICWAREQNEVAA